MAYRCEPTLSPDRTSARRARITEASRASAVLVSVVLVVSTLGLGACESDPVPAGPCNLHPFDCAANQTCWPNASNGFECMAAGVGKQGDACQLVPGQPSCGPNLLCLMPAGTTTGTCTIYCETLGDAHGCPTGLSCSIFTLGTNGAQLDACSAAVSATSSTGSGG